MLQMVRTLAQFTIALEDMRDIGDGIDAAFATSGLSGAAEELPEKGCAGRAGNEVMAKRGPGVGAGTRGGGPVGCGGEVGVQGCVMFGHVCRSRHLWGLRRDCRGNGASILILGSTPAGFSGLRGGGMLPPGEGEMGGQEPSLPPPPPPPC